MAHSCEASKVSVGKFYLAIDKNLKEKGIRADYAYILIKSKYPDEEMTYGVSKEKMLAEMMNSDIISLNEEVKTLTQQLETSRKELNTNNCELRDITKTTDNFSKRSH